MPPSRAYDNRSRDQAAGQLPEATSASVVDSHLPGRMAGSEIAKKHWREGSAKQAAGLEGARGEVACTGSGSSAALHAFLSFTSFSGTG